MLYMQQETQEVSGAFGCNLQIGGNDMHQNNEKVVLKDVLKIGGAYAAFCIGSGFATGQEIMQFFTAFGWAGIGSAIITMILYVWMGVTLMRDGRKYSFTSDAAVWKHYCGKGLGVAMNCFGTFVIFGIYVVMIGGAGASMEQYLGIPNLAGRLIMSAICLVVALMGLSRLVDVIGFIGPVIIVCALAIGFITIVRDAGAIATAQQILSTVEVPSSCGNWVLSGFLYSGFMAFMIIPFIAQLGHSSKGSRKSGMLGGACGGFFQVVAIIVMLIAQMCNIGLIHDAQVPSLVLAEKINPVLAGVFVIIVLMGIFSTAVPLLWMLGHKAGPDKTKKFNITTVILVVAALILSVLPFTVLVNKVYGWSGYVGIFAMAFTLISQLRIASQEKKGQLPTGEPASENK